MSKHLLALYIRVSHEEENEGESNSIKNQREFLKAFVSNSPDFISYKVVEFCDDGYSGTNFDRPAVKALLEEVREGTVYCIIVKDLSRFGRNYIDLGDYLEQIFPFLGVRFIAVNDHYDSKNFDGITAGLDVGFRNLIYAMYSNDLSQKVKSAMKTRMEKGEFISSHAPYGYVKSPENCRKLMIDEKAASIVRRIFTMAEEGKNAVQIAAILNSENIPTPYLYKKLMGCDRKYNVVGDRNYWHNTTILTILRDERYTGKMINGKYRNQSVGCKHGKRVPKREWIIVPDTHDAIVSEELFASVQNRFFAPARTRTEQEVRPFLGKVRCGICRHAMRRRKNSSSSVYYYCESHKYVVDSNCTKDRIFENSLIQTVLSVIHKQIEVMLDMEQLLLRVKTKNHNDKIALMEQTRHLQTVLAKLRASKLIAYEKYRDGILDRGQYISLKEEVNKQITETDARITELKSALQSSYRESSYEESSYREMGQQGFIIENLMAGEGVTKLSKEMVDELIDSIYVYGNEAIEIVWNHMDNIKFTL